MKVALYIRVSTKDQDTEIQRQDLLNFCEYKRFNDVVLFEEKFSGTTSQRPKLIELKSRLDEFDIVICWKLDRLFRSLKDLLNTIELFEKKNTTLISLKENVDMATKEGRLMLQILGSFAEYEAEMIRERVKSGINNYIEKHGTWGKKPSVDKRKVLLLHSKGLSQRKIAKELGTHKNTIQRILDRERR